MLKLARWSTTHRLYVILIWVATIAAVGALAHTAGTTYSNNFTLPNSDAQRAGDLLANSFPAQAGDRDQIVFRTTNGSVRDAAMRKRMSAMFATVRRLPHVGDVIGPYAADSSDAISRSGKIAFATVVFDEKASALPKTAIERVIHAARAPAGPGLQIELGGSAIEATEAEGLGLSTAIGLAAAIAVLLLTFGSVVAMGLPIITALLGLGTGLGLIALFTHLVDTPSFSSELAAMVGLGVGIDYALFIVTRFREAYRSPGPSEGKIRESVVEAMDTAGRAVLFAGCTVVIALLGMMLLGVTFLYGVALSAAIGVLLMMLTSVTLLPALLTLAGGRIVRPSRRALRKQARQAEHGAQEPGARDRALSRAASSEHPRVRAAAARLAAASRRAAPIEPCRWLRWSAFVQRRPKTIALVATLSMLLVAAPAGAMRLGSSDASDNPTSFTTYRAYELLARGFGPGFNGPLQVVAQLPRGAGTAPVKQLAAAIARAHDVASVAPPRLNPTGRVATFSVYPRSSPQAEETTDLVSQLREATIPPLAAADHMHVYVGGVTAGALDFAEVLSEKLPLFIGVVTFVSALLLLLVFRSLVIPLQGALMNLLSIGASLGVVVAIFQWGWLPQLFHAHPGPIESFIPVMLFAIVFGLSMDYEVFLVSRMHERWVRTGDASRAVGEGLALTGRVITAAAAIMVVVFLSFMVGESRVIEEFGLALASAVFIDAVIVRSMLLPAVMDVMGAASWRLPAWLDRLLPRLNVEGSPDHVLPFDRVQAVEEELELARASARESERVVAQSRADRVRANS
jgi:RND superfamily putative drug exporter